MSLDRHTKRNCFALGAALAFAASAAFADAPAPQPPVPEAPVKVAVADNNETMQEARTSTTPYVYPSSEAGVRRAAEQGPLALHLYIYRTRMIYNYLFLGLRQGGIGKGGDAIKPSGAQELQD